MGALPSVGLTEEEELLIFVAEVAGSTTGTTKKRKAPGWPTAAAGKKAAGTGKAAEQEKQPPLSQRDDEAFITKMETALRCVREFVTASENWKWLGPDSEYLHVNTIALGETGEGLTEFSGRLKLVGNQAGPKFLGTPRDSEEGSKRLTYELADHELLAKEGRVQAQHATITGSSNLRVFLETRKVAAIRENNSSLEWDKLVIFYNPARYLFVLGREEFWNETFAKEMAAHGFSGRMYKHVGDTAKSPGLTRICLPSIQMLGLPREIYCSEQKSTQPAVKKARAEKQAGAAAAAVVSMESDATDATESGNE